MHATYLLTYLLIMAILLYTVIVLCVTSIQLYMDLILS